MMRKLFPREQGQVSIMLAVSMTTLLGVVGLALSAGMSYMIKAKLNAATDAASLAAARATSIGGDQATQTANAKAAAQRFFHANFPANYMMSTATLNDTNVAFTGGAVTINVSASATMPTVFLGNLASGPLAPGALTETKRKDLDMVIALDTSGSLLNEAATVRSSAVTFLKQFNESTDRVGLLHFSYGSVVDVPIRPTQRGFDRTSMVNSIGRYQFNGSTASPEGMWRARDQINSVPTAGLNRSNLRVIVFFSDGAPNSFGTYLTWKNRSYCDDAGVVNSGDGSTGEAGGLYDLNQQADDLGGTCTPETLNYYPRYKLKDLASVLPDWYNGHLTKAQRDAQTNDATLREFPIVTSWPRVVTNAITHQNVNRASRNLVEAMAAKSRDEGIFVFTLGLGAALKAGSGPDGEKGEDVLKCMANSIDSRCFNANKPIGVYCHAATQADLTPCFSKLASAILKITK
jgi:Flp pilus assembly protein TadG